MYLQCSIKPQTRPCSSFWACNGQHKQEFSDTSTLFSRELDATWAGDAVLLGWAQGLLNCCWLHRGGTQPIKHLMNLSLMGF